MGIQPAPERPAVGPWAYFLTFACYGARLHGDVRGSVDDRCHIRGTRYISAEPQWAAYEAGLLKSSPISLDSSQRHVALRAILGVCKHESWDLHGVHVRSTHLHVVLSASVKPEKAMGKLKAYCSRALNQTFGRTERRWAAHGSTLWLWDELQTQAAVRYVICEQGEPMAAYVNDLAWLPRDYDARGIQTNRMPTEPQS